MLDRKISVKERNESIAKFLGWSKEKNELRDDACWYKNFGGAIGIAYQPEYPYYSLPFNKDLNYLFQAIDKIRKIKDDRNSNEAKKDEYILSEFEIKANSFFCKLYQWMGRGKGWRMFGAEGLNTNGDLSILYIVNENCEDWREGLFLFISDIILTLQNHKP